MPDHIPDPIWDPVAESGLAVFIRESIWAYPALETLHLFGIALVFGPILMFDLRVLGRGRDFNVRRLHQTLVPWVWTGFLINLVSGCLMFLSDASEFARNPAFLAKLVLLAVAGGNALLFQNLIFPRLPGSDDTSLLTKSARASAALSILIWMAIIVAGRLMAYVK